MSLEELRKKIDLCDAQLEQLFQKRLQLVEEIGRRKKEGSLSIYDPHREAAILKGRPGPLADFFQTILRLSRRKQAGLFFPYNIILVGFMGTGKTSVGQELAHRLGRPFLDTDQILEKEEKLSIPQLFQLKGEAFFRRKEKELIARLAEREEMVLACGGGAVLDPQNVKHLEKKGRLVLLTALAETVYKRVGAHFNRPLLGAEISLEEIFQLQKKRQAAYESSAHIQVATDQLGVGEVVDLILQKLREGEGQ